PLHSARGSPRSRHLTFLTFRPQTRGAAHISLYPPSQRMQCVPGFVLSPQTRHSTPPNQVRHPTDRQFVSGCSPPRLAATQLPSTTGPWLTPTRTCTVLCARLQGRTRSSLCERMTAAPNRHGYITHPCSPGDRAPTHSSPSPEAPPCRSSLCERMTAAPNPLWAHSPPRSPGDRAPTHSSPSPEAPP